MKKNTWVFYFFIVLFTALLSINLVWRFTPAKKEIGESLEKRLRPYLGDSFSINDFTLGFGYISFYNITAGSGEHNYQLQLDEIQIGYSIHKLFLHKFDFLQVIESITFKNPKLILWTGETGSSSQIPPNSLDAREVIGGFRKLAEIDRIFIQNGEIYWGKSPENITKFISGLKGLIIVESEKHAMLDLNGKLFDASSPDLTLSGKVNLNNEGWDINAEFDDCRLSEGLPFFNGQSFTLQNAVLDGKLSLHCPSFYVRDMEAKGDLAVKNMSGLLFGQQLKTDDYTIQFRGQKMELPPVSGNVEDGHFVLTGSFGEIFSPGLYLNIDFDNYSAKNIAISAPILELLNKGKVQGHLDVNGPKSNLVVTGNIYSSKLNYTFVPFYRSSLDFIFEKKIWTFRNIKTDFIKMEHHGTGAIDFNTNTISLELFSQKHIGDSVFHILDRLNNNEMQYHTTMQGDFPTLTFTGLVQGWFRQPEDTVLAAQASFKLVKDKISVRGIGSSPKGIVLHAEASDLWNDPTFDILEVKNVPFDSLSSLETVREISRKFKTDFYFSGPVNYPSAKANFINRNSGDIFFSLSGSAINLIQGGLKFNGGFAFQTSPNLIQGRISLQDAGDHLQTRLTIPQVAQGEISIGYGNSAPLTGEIRLEKISPFKYLGDFPALYHAISEGQIFGDIKFSGTSGNPLVNFDIEGENFIINQNGYYSSRFKGRYTLAEFALDEGWVSYNNRPIFQTTLKLDLANDNLSAQFAGDQIESNFLAATIFDNPNLIQGNFQYQIKMEGPFRRPLISGGIDMHNGIFEDRVFKNLTISFEDSIPPTSSIFDIKTHVFKVLKLLYVDKKDYTIEADGLFPADPKGNLDIHMNVKGNILSELPEVIPFFQNPNCLGELLLHIGGTWDNPQMNSGHLSIYTGSMDFESVIPPLKELKADMEMNEGDQFIHIKNLEGKLGGRTVSIHNVLNVSTQNENLKPWYFEDLGLNFGILILDTDPKGIPLSIPGLMNPGDIGYVAADGKEKGEEFYFAGPPDLPHARGKVTLYDSRITFPFLVSPEEAESMEDNKVYEFLTNLDWDVMAVSGVGNRYFVDIPALIGQVYMDLNIDNVSTGLEFTGRLVDESFRVEGGVESTRGRVEYLDMDFRVERFGAVFNRFELYPEVYGRAYTTVRDSTNFPKDIYLELYTIDPETKQEVSRGRWEDFRFKLVSSDPTIGESQENVLAYLGYSVGNFSNKASNVGLTLTENLLVRPLVRPLERKLERSLKLDYVRLQSSITSNLINFGFQNRFKFLQQPNYYHQNLNNNFDPALLLLQSSEITLGKYLLKDFYLTYSGQLVSVYDESKLGLNHRLGLEYRLLRNLLLEIEYDKFQFNPEYYSKDALNDFKIRLRHSFNF